MSKTKLPVPYPYYIIGYIGPIAIVVFWLISSLALDASRSLWQPAKIIPQWCLAVCTIPACVYLYLRYRSLRRSLRSHEGKLCVKCAYDLRHIQDGQPCPECGRMYHAQNDLAAWRKHVDF